ncbi:MAG: DNA translocase FtsK, partial [Verrucomicrobia bacterium]|nr:DNA translocase FtsK [Verrucomicrobiota bacterium]
MASRKRAQRIEEKTIEKRWDIIGVTVAAFGLMLLFALTTYNKGDLSATSQQYANWIGPFGAYLAKGFLWTFGLGAFLFPLIFIAWGLSIPISLLHHLQRRWPWMLLLAVTLCCGLDIHFNLFPPHLSENLSTMSPGGFVGYILYHYVFFIFGKIGATIILLTLYLISIISLTNVKLDEWIAIIIERFRQMREEAARRHKEAQARRKAEEAERKKQKQLLLENRKAEQEAERLRKEEEKRAKEEERRRKEEEAEAERLRLEEERANKDTEDEIVAEVIDEDELLEENTSEDDSDENELSEEENQNKQAQYKIIDAYSPDKLKERENTSILPSVRTAEDYELPSTELLNPIEPLEFEGESEDEMTQNAEAIRQTLADFRIEVEPGPITRGPSITLYEFIPARGVKMSRFNELSNNIAAALKAISINILAPIPGKNSVGIEVPNKNKVPVIIRELLESPEWINSKGRLPIALGKDIYGKPVITDLASTPHLLVAGSTGSGKSVCINTIIVSLLYTFSPEQLRFIMVDPKQVELQQYNDLPHMIIPVVTDPKKAVLALQWLVNEMEKRYKLFAKVGVRKIEEFNKRMSKQQVASPAPDPEETEQEEQTPVIEEEAEALSTEEEHLDMGKDISVPRDEEKIPDKLGYIVLIVDELNDLMMVAGKDVQDLIMRITQLARAAGIHCIIATQRPSVDVITGVIKANIPARIAFKVSNRQDSNTILDSIGAEKLLGYGDMLFLPPGKPKKRIQGAYVSDDEINSILDHIKTQAQPNFFEDLESTLERSLDEADDKNEDEELIQKCIDLIYSLNRSNISLLRRILKLGFGYNRAARIMDILERRGIVGPSR